MLSKHLQNGIEASKLAWSPLPNSEDAENNVLVGLRKKDDDDAGVESLDGAGVVLDSNDVGDDETEHEGVGGRRRMRGGGSGARPLVEGHEEGYWVVVVGHLGFWG